MMTLAVSLVLLLLQYWFLYQFCFQSFPKTQRIFLALIISINIFLLFSSMSYFLSLNLVFGSLNKSTVELLILLLCSFGLLGLMHLTRAESWVHSRINSLNELSSPVSHPELYAILDRSRVSLTLKVLTLLAVVIAVIYCLSKFYLEPHGEWDAWAIWNLKARFLYRVPDEWVTGFTSVLNWSHPDYPLFLPALVAKLWNLIGNEKLIVSHLIAGFYLCGTAYVMYCILSKLVNTNIACLSLLVLFSSYTYIRNSVFLTADLPLANLLLLSVCLFSCYLVFKQVSMLILAVLFLSAILWVKNEGQLIFPVFFLCYLLQLWRSNDLKKLLLPVFIVALPSLITFGVFKNQISLANDLFESNTIQAIFDRAFDFTRYSLVLISFMESIIDIFKANLIFVIAFLIYFRKKILNFDGKSILIAMLVCLAGYLSIYLFITPLDLAWHLETSMERIVLHFYPVFIFMLFLLPAQRTNQHLD